MSYLSCFENVKRNNGSKRPEAPKLESKCVIALQSNYLNCTDKLQYFWVIGGRSNELESGRPWFNRKNNCICSREMSGITL
tara:strand:+ start:852 stop:1094 length:243 start_codon:yes stop_codon:yes gene_type:complete